MRSCGRSPGARSHPLAAVLLLAFAAAASPARPQGGAEPADTAPVTSFTAREVEDAAKVLRANPDLSGTRTERTLRFKPSDADDKPRPRRERSWLRDLFGWLSETSRVLVWGLGALALVLALVGLRYWLREREAARAATPKRLPSHVRDLDIRVESLPDDIGATARALWERGETRAALSLLYRGALSRLVHVHAVPIHASSTEGECVRLAQQALPAERSEFFAQLVRAWELAVYGARLPAAERVQGLCAQFDACLGQTAAGAAGPTGAAAP